VKKAIASIVVVVLVAFIGIQLIRPQLTNPPVTADLKAPEQVKQILQNSCYSCHSNETSLPWYDQLAPAYWLVTTDVKQGREHLNFSYFDKLPAAQQKGVLFESINQIQLGAMPPERYKAVHPGSAVTAAQLPKGKRLKVINRSMCVQRRMESPFLPDIRTGRQSAAPNDLTITR
jgi:heme-binding protein